MAAASKSKKLETPPHQWSHLPQELLDLIFGKLTSFSDHLRFRSICKSWRSAAKFVHHRRRIPLLMIPNNSTTTCSFLNPCNFRIITIDLPELRGHVVCGSSIGWIVMINKKLEVSLLNPITGSTILLPSTFGTFVRSLDLEEFMNRDNNCSFSNIVWAFECYAFMDNYPNDCIVAFTNKSKQLVYCGLGDVAWTEVSSDLSNIASLAYHKEKLYAIDKSGNLAVCDLGGSDPKRKFTTIMSLNRQSDCRIVAWNEDLLVVNSHANSFEIYKLDTSIDLRWERLNAIGDLKLFSGMTRVILASDAFGLRGDSIYFLLRSWRGVRLASYHIGSGRFVHSPDGYFSELSRWFIANFC